MGKEIRLVFDMSDLHVGSKVAVCPPDYECEGDTSIERIHLNPFQELLYGCWIDTTTEWMPRIANGDPYAVVINGDAVEGIHHGGGQTWSKNTAHHVDACCRLLEPITDKAAKVFIVRGTECHTRTDEQSIGVQLGAVKDPNTGLAAWDHLPLTIHGCKVSFRHHIGTAGRPYLESGELGRALATERLEAMNNGWPIPDVCVRAHRHRAGQFTDDISMMVVTGAWQGPTRYVHKAVPGAISRPSMVALDWRGLKSGSLPRVHSTPRYLCPPPQGVTL